MEVLQKDRKKVQFQNMGCLSLLIILIVVVAWLIGHKNKTSETVSDSDTYQAPTISHSTYAENDPYETMSVAFEGYPSKEQIQPMLEDVMKFYDLPVTDSNLMKVASMLVSLRKESKVGVTEMEILKHIYQHRIPQLKLPDQAALSSVILEKSK